MLRLLVIALLLLNVVLAGLQWLQAPVQKKESPVSSAPPSGDTPSIRLISELESASGAAPGTSECFVAGPWETPEGRDALLAEVAPRAAWIGMRETEASVETGAWVLLPVQADYVTARSMAMTLRDAGFTDAEVVMEGEWKHAVTLGFYRSEANATIRLEEARSLGFPAKKRAKVEQQTRYWLDFEQRTGAAYVGTGPEKAGEAGLLRAVPCPDSGGPGNDGQ